MPYTARFRQANSLTLLGYLCSINSYFVLCYITLQPPYLLKIMKTPNTPDTGETHAAVLEALQTQPTPPLSGDFVDQLRRREKHPFQLTLSRGVFGTVFADEHCAA